ncbi:CBS domain-containing protein [Shiella aurantiaca]|nr:CBS domain-containing protein [Shiella aurantiaca]
MSYQGEAAKEVKEAALQPMLVSDFMTKDLITFRADQTIFQAIDILIKHRITGGPVVNENNELIGVLSEGDCLKEVVKGKYDNMPMLSGTVGDHMTKTVTTIPPEMNVFEAAQLFLSKRIRRFPIVKDGKLVGQISQRDVIKAVREM